MITVGDRIKYLIDKQGLSLRQFCKNNDILYTGMSSIISNDREIGMKVLQQLKSAIPDMDTEWVLFGSERQDVSKYSNTQNTLQTKEESVESWGNDIFVEAFLKCLEKPSIQERLMEILSKKK